MTPTERGERAAQLLADPVMKEAFATVRERLVAQLENTPMTAHEVQHEAVIALQVLKTLQTQLFTFKNDVAVDKHREKHNKFIEKVKQSIRSL